ncbi:stage V sporulation protein AC [Alteribacillus bidgolensis]|uniref:Stage V sporulation protein AC n=1 Tax=Alteribacillus bidgolensis TaxID=930129 RepID=A0A1G8BYL7_9BACI|nr:stage V sporulation protein AC [Alteribacillus bidgolensis]SDH38225.1 stage V sporulation protein AC [Alteribacillus bidgolensis]
MSQQKQEEDVKTTYQKFASKDEPKRPVVANCIKAFFIGGLICIAGQAIQNFFLYNFDFNEQTAGNPTIAVLILIAVLLTGFGVYDKFAQFAGAGSAVPVTGFANAMASAAIEHRTEGPVFGIGSNMFKLAGPVIVFGTTAAFVIALIKTIWTQIGG